MTKGKFSASAAILSTALLLTSLPATAQGEAFMPEHSQQYSQVTDWPDFSGVWSPDLSYLFGRNGRLPARPVLTPKGQESLDAFLEKQAREGISQHLQANCIPPGMPAVMRQPYPIEFIYSPGRVTIFIEAYSQARRLYVDGRALPLDPDPLFNGNSAGRWEGDVLVMDSVGFSPLVTYMAGIEPSEKTQIHEHMWLAEDNLLMIETTITDPVNLAEPFVQLLAYKRQADWDIREYVCAENNRLKDEEGGANIDLGFGDENDPFGPPAEDIAEE